MTLHDYGTIIANSVAESGYDAFYPSACVSTDAENEFHVLRCDLSETGDERAALSWVESLPNSSGTVFLAFRGGARRVTVAELKDGALVGGFVIHVKPHSEASA